jgi:zinc/manganese transport system substrate-binding protein
MGLRGRSVVGLLSTVLAVVACGSERQVVRDAPNEPCRAEPVPIVVTVDQWGDIVRQLAGSCGDVTTIISSSSIDPHDYEPTPADNATFADAELVVLNGLGYDAWAQKALDASGRQPAVVNAGEVVGLHEGANPHVWYGPDYVLKVADAVTGALQQVRPDAAPAFAKWRAAFTTSLEPYSAEIADVRSVANGASYGATESVFEYMATAVGLVDATPPGFENAAANGSDPAPADIDAFDRALSSKTMSVLVYNIQTQGAIPAQIRSAAERAGVPVVEVTETVAKGATGFVDWQVAQLQRLAAALRESG